MARQIVRKTPFPTGYSESARVNADFGDWDDYEVGEMPGSAAELEQDRKANSPLYRENLRFKNPKALANQIENNYPTYDRSRVLNFLEHYGDHMTDDAYLDFAKSKGFEPKNYDENGRGYYNEYINNEDFLKQVHDIGALNGEWDDYEFAGIDADYERAFGPVTNDEQYQSYLKWLKGGN